ncbi:hypothetical protein AAE478_009318 [Parahypoxylon ruwenzoriense]
MDYPKDIYPSGLLPYPDMIQIHSVRDQRGFFMEPMKPSSYGGVGTMQQSAQEKALEETIGKACRTFGSLTRVYVQVRPGQGLFRTAFYRRDRGTIDHGLGRNEEEVYECAKYNILRHPQDNEYNDPNYVVEPSSRVTGLDRVILDLAHYPFIPRAVMAGPLLPRYRSSSTGHRGQESRAEGCFSKPEHKQPDAFTQFCRSPELFTPFLEIVGCRYGDLSNLSRTCQTAMYAINGTATRFDWTTGNFLNSNFTDEEVEIANARMANGVEFVKPRSSAVVIVSKVRGPYKGHKDSKPNEFGYPAPPTGSFYKETAENDVAYTHRFLRGIHLRGSAMKILMLHSVPYFDVSVLKKCLEWLPNLKVLGIHNCELLHFGCTVEVLETIVGHNKKEGANFIQSDFSPFYYPGPPHSTGRRKGEYGVVASDHGTVDTIRAVAAILGRAIPLALENGIDWFTPGTGMRQFLERLPFPLGTLRYILEAWYNIYTFEKGGYHPWVEKDNWALFKSQYENGTRFGAMRRTLYNDLILAVQGASMDYKLLYDMMTLRGKFALVHCAFCNTDFPACLFTRESSNRVAGQIQCMGCQLLMLFDSQVDNFFQEKKEVVRRLFDDPRITGLESFMTGTRVASDDEIGDSKFPFWLMSVKSRAEIWALRTPAIPGAFVLDGRPGPPQSDEAKKIRLSIERTMRAMKYARIRIDQGHEGLEPIVADCERQIETVEEEYLTNGPRNASERRKNRNLKDDLERYIEQEYARCGLGQMRGRHGATAAANWDFAITRYRQLVQADAGAMVNHGPYDNIWNNKPTGFW